MTSPWPGGGGREYATSQIIEAGTAPRNRSTSQIPLNEVGMVVVNVLASGEGGRASDRPWNGRFPWTWHVGE